MSHTPGPWYAEKDPYDESRLVCAEQTVTADGGEWNPIVAICLDEEHVNQKANAKLIAAAPELLDALELVIETIETGGFQSAALVIAKAAIAKVRV